MRFVRSWAPVLGWCAATVTSIALAWVALLPVLRTAAPGDSAPSIEQLRQAGADVRPAVTLTAPTGLPAAVPSTSTRPDRPSPAPPATPPPRDSPAVTSPAPTPSRGGATAAPPTTTEDGWTVTTEDGVTSYLRSFRVAGGQAVIRVTEGRVQLVTATPSPGYSVESVQNTADNLAVYFIEPNHHFIIHAVWRDDRPFAQVSEVGG